MKNRPNDFEFFRALAGNPSDCLFDHFLFYRTNGEPWDKIFCLCVTVVY